MNRKRLENYLLFAQEAQNGNIIDLAAKKTEELAKRVRALEIITMSLMQEGYKTESIVLALHKVTFQPILIATFDLLAVLTTMLYDKKEGLDGLTDGLAKALDRVPEMEAKINFNTAEQLKEVKEIAKDLSNVMEESTLEGIFAELDDLFDFDYNEEDCDEDDEEEPF